MKKIGESGKEICRFAAAAGAILMADFICREYNKKLRGEMMRYTFSKMSILGSFFAVIGFILTIQGIAARYNLTNIKDSYEESEIKRGRYIQYDIAQEQLIKKHYTDMNGTMNYLPYCANYVTKGNSVIRIYIAAVNEDSDYFVPLLVGEKYQEDFDKMLNSADTYHVFGKFEKLNKIYYNIITDETEVEQMISPKHQIKIVDSADERKIIYKGFSLLATGLFLLFVTIEKEKR